MRIRILLALLLALPLVPIAARAQAIMVQSGEHPGFSRLVLELGQPVPWTLGRTADGYELKLDGANASFDLSQVYRLIPHDRLAAIWVDPTSGNLQLGVGCACHAMPFEFRPDVLVVDLKDGPPPPGSSFETALDGADLPRLAARAVPRPRTRPGGQPSSYDWRAAALAAAPAAGSPAPARSLSLPTPKADLAPLRNSLLQQMSEGAAQGVVDMTLPQPQGGDLPAAADPASGLVEQIRVGEDLGFVAGPLPPDLAQMTADGGGCLADEKLAIETWGEALPVAEQMAPSLAALTGEFDRPDPEAISRAVRFYLYLGFGAEARQLLRELELAPEDQTIWRAMAIILDEDPPTENPFEGMLVCDSSAALWAVLAHPHLAIGDAPNTQAVLRTFSALPLHLRRHLGPPLAARFLERNDTETARALRDAVLRAPGDPGPQVRLMGAEIDRAMGDPGAADQTLQQLASEGGPVAARALIAEVEVQIDHGQPVDMPTVTALAALAFEHRGSEIEPALQRAHLLALAAAGDFASAFGQLALAPDTEPDLWRILAEHGPDSAVLEYAVLEPETAPPTLPVETRRLLVDRLLTLGFPDPALRWLPKGLAPGPATPDQDRLLAAKAQMQRRDAREALRLVAGLTGPEADRLRAEAHARLGDPVTAASLLAALGDLPGEQRAARQAQGWALIADHGQDPWQAAARLVLPAPAGSAASLAVAPQSIPGPLARGRQTVAESAAARATLTALLAEVPVVVTPPVVTN
ncbi:MAG: hypothetical protein Q8Q26_18155 [Pseudorhodobacter sp.]|nr:hypothetical protein [Pseudorhodobacter sp.]